MARSAHDIRWMIAWLAVLLMAACEPRTPTPGPVINDPATPAPTETIEPPTSPPQRTDVPAPVLPTGYLLFEMNFDVGLSELQIVELDCELESRLCQNNPIRLLCQPLNGSSPVWSPDGTHIAFSSTQDGDSDIYIAPFEALADLPICPDDLIPLTHNDVSDITPAWSPDGSRIAFASNRGGNFNLYVIDRDGSNLRALTDNGDFHAAPTWSPDGTRLAFETRFANNRSSLFAIDAEGENLTLLSDPGENASDPAWSPDGSRIAFVSDRDGNADIFVMDPDGGNVITVTRSPRYDAGPAWSPDGQFLAFASQRRDSLDIYLVPLACLDGPLPCDDRTILLWDNVLIEAAPAWGP